MPALPSFEAIHREFHPKVLRYLARLAGADEAADLAQVTMIKVNEHLAGFRGESSLSTWIYRIATNVARDRLRQRSPDSVPIDDLDADRPVLDAGVPAQLRVPSTEAAVARREMSACVRGFVDRLPENYRTVLVLADIEGRTNGEIAEITGFTLDTVKIRLHRARAKLRDDLRRGCVIGRDERDEVACDRKQPILLK